ncbi:MAG TPA: alpha/beta fold hydrolase [Herbaspirillum sp.]|uniref:alpha/beta fold hydrolase n=1 Tax=Herbaspirillum sp. TaxID=1890675 RepID=UPI002D3EDAC0|nr:alpha/beta fold hydrolase [Herbaspirillum sp.]HZG19365.1 alpha/beta fold hydrolase [Herbaspirillum sp.]
MANYLLIHDVWQGKWVWPAVTAELTMRGHEVHSIDLPGSGADLTPHDQVSLPLQIEAIVRAIAVIGKRVTLVGHGIGGIAVSAAAEQAADSLARLIYLSAFVPGNEDGLNLLADLASSLQAQVDAVAAPTLATSRTQTFMQDAPHAVASWAVPQFRAQALAPLLAPVQLTPERYGQVPKSYIVCTRDRAIEPVLQRRMATRAGCARVKELASDHSPFLSRPGETAEILHRMATEL